MAVPMSQFALRVTADDADPATVERFALDLRAELAEIVRIDPAPGGPAPDGARAVELLAVFGFVITMVQAGEAVSKVVKVIQAVAARYAARRRGLRVSLDGVDVDLSGLDDATAAALVDRLLAAQVQRLAGVRSALVVANAAYDDPRLTRLRAPGSDADALARVLGDPAIGGFDVELLVDADERTVRRRIAAFFADRDRDDVLLLHFSGHGLKDQRGRLYLAARDTDLAVLGATSVPAAFVNDLLAETQSQRVVLILDCCYSGAFARGGQPRGGTEVHVADEFGAGSGRVVLTASSATEYAFEGGELTEDAGRPSVFTSALVRGLETGAADLDADGDVGIDELYDYTYRAVRESTPDQAPMKWSFGVEGSVVIARSPRPAALPVSVHDDLASDRIVLRLEAVRALEQLLAGDRAGLRAAALAALVKVRDEDDSFRVRAAAAQALGTPLGAVPESGRPAPPVGERPAGPSPVTADPPVARAAPGTAGSAVQSPPAGGPQPAAAAGPRERVGPADLAAAVPATGPAHLAPAVPATGPAHVAPAAPEPGPAAVAAPGPAAMAAPEPEPAAPGVSGPVFGAQPEPAGTPGGAPPAGAGRPGTPPAGLVLAAAVLVLVGALLGLTGYVGTGAPNWGSMASLIGELVVAVGVLVVRRPVPLGLLAGWVSWAWLFPTVVGSSTTHDYMSANWAPVVVGNLLELAGSVVTWAALITGRRRADRPRWAAAAVLVVPIGIAAYLGVDVAALLFSVTLSGAALTLTPLLAVGCVVPVPLVLVTGHRPAVVAATLAGWLLSGVQSAADATRYAMDPTGSLWTMLAIVAVLGAGAVVLVGRRPVR